jgi:PST family polysaccharide transporter
VSGARGVGRKTRQGLSWTAGGAIASKVVRLAVLAILSRLLAPTDFGLVAAVMVVIQLGSLIKDLGVGLALVQRKDLDPEHVEAAFMLSLLFGIGLSVAIAIAAAPIADFFDMEGSVSLIRVLGLLFFFRGVGLVPSFMLKRAMRFKALTILDFLGYVAGSILSVTLAFHGYGVWSLVWGYMLETAVNVLMLLYLSPPPLTFQPRPRHLRELLGFGLGKSLAGIGNYLATQGDYIVVGRVLDKTQLGLYQRAYDLVRFPANVFSTVAGSVLFSAFARVQDDFERLARAYRRAMFASALVLLPTSVALIVLAPEVISILMGDQWGFAVSPFRIMALTMLFRTTYKLGVMVGRSSGQVFHIAVWQFVYAGLVIGGAAISVRWGLDGVAATTAFAVAVNFVAMSWIGARVTQLPIMDLVRAHAAPLLITTAIAATVWPLASTLRAAEALPIVVAGVSTVAGTIVFLILAIALARRGRGDWPWLVEALQSVLRRKRKQRAPEV